MSKTCAQQMCQVCGDTHRANYTEKQTNKKTHPMLHLIYLHRVDNLIFYCR